MPGSFWVPARRPLLQYVKLLTAAAGRGDSAEVAWFLSQQPTNLPDLQPEAFHCALFAAVLFGHHKTVQILLQQQNPEKAPMVLPVCIQLVTEIRTKGVVYGAQLEEAISFLGMAYGWDHFAPRFKPEEEEKQLISGRGGWLTGPQYLGLLQLLLEYGVQPASAIDGLLQRLVCTVDMAAVAMLQAHHLDIRNCQLSDGRTLLHLLVSSRFHSEIRSHTSSSDNDRAALCILEKQVKDWQNQATPLLQLLVSNPVATRQHDSNNKTAMDICLPEYKQFMSAMNNARLSAQPVQRGKRGSSQTQCVVCLDQHASVVIVPCGHLCVCQLCSSRLQQQCPVCRAAAAQMIQTFSP